MKLSRIKLRLATMEDADFLLNLKNDEDVRKNSIVSHDLIEKENHIAWLTAKLNDPMTKLYVLCDNEEKYGDIRFDIAEEIEVSIRICKEFRHMGIATRMVGAGCDFIEKVFNKRFIAKIVEGNIASMNVFIDNNFRFRSYGDGVYVLEA